MAKVILEPECEHKAQPQGIGKPHVEVVADVRKSIERLLQDPLLNDLGRNVTPDEVSSQLALLQGRALTLQLRFYNENTIPIVVLQGSTVRNVMQAIERGVKAKKKETTVISWRYVWRTYWLACGQVRLEDESKKLASYGLGNHSELRFVRKQKRKITKF